MEKTFERNENCQAMAGINAVYYIDIDNVTLCVPKNDGINVTLANGKSWCEIECDEAKSSATCEGLAYRHVVDLVYHGNQQEVSNDLMELTQRRVLVKVVDTNGSEWLYGTIGTPLRFSFESVNDGEPSGETAFKLHFEALCGIADLKLVS